MRHSDARDARRGERLGRADYEHIAGLEAGDFVVAAEGSDADVVAAGNAG